MNLNDGFKMTELGEIPFDWVTEKIENVSSLCTNGFVGTASPYYTSESNGIPYLMSNNIRRNRIDYRSFVHITPEFHESCERSQLLEGDLLMVQSGHIGTVCTVPISLDGANCHALIITRFNKNIINSKFVAYYLNSESGIASLAGDFVGSTIKHINTKELKKHLIPIPPLPEQQKIADFLSTVDEHISETESLIEKTKVLKQGMMQQLLTKGIGHAEFKDTEIGRIPVEWEVKELGDCVISITGGGTPSRDVQEYYSGNIPWVTVKDMNGSFYMSDAQEHITADAIKNSASNLVPEGSVIIATRMGLGRGFINTVSIAINQDLKALIPKENIFSVFLLYFYLSIGEFISSQGSGSTVKGIRLELLRSLLVPLPPLIEQHNIADILSTIGDQIDSYKAKQTSLTKLKSALMQQLLTGKTRVKI